MADSLRGIETFVKAVQGGSLAQAARSMGITPAAASQNIARLEEGLGTRLLKRTTRALSLTEAGALYYRHVKDLVERLEEAGDALASARGTPSGRLLVASSVAFGRHVVAPLLPQFHARYPEVEVELALHDRSVDLVTEDFDLAIRFDGQTEPGWVARRLAVMPMFLCASPEYLREHGRPRTLEDLADHLCLRFRFPVTGKILPWHFRRKGRRVEAQTPRMQVCNDVDAIARMVLAGGGVSRLGSFLCQEWIDAGRLVPIALDAEAEPLSFHACFIDRRHLPAKTRVFLDFLVQAMAEHPSTVKPRIRRR